MVRLGRRQPHHCRAGENGTLHAGGEISAGGERDLLAGTGGDGRQKNHINEMRGWFRIGTAPEKHQRYSANHSF